MTPDEAIRRTRDIWKSRSWHPIQFGIQITEITQAGAPYENGPYPKQVLESRVFYGWSLVHYSFPYPTVCAASQAALDWIKEHADFYHHEG